MMTCQWIFAEMMAARTIAVVAVGCALTAGAQAPVGVPSGGAPTMMSPGGSAPVYRIPPNAGLDPAPAPAEPGASSALAGHTIVLDIAAADRRGVSVPQLGENDFTVIDNGKPRRLQSFHAVDAGREQPVRVLIVIDQLNVELRGLNNEEQQVVRFLRGHDGPLPLPTSLAVFTEKGVQMEPAFSTDGVALGNALEKLGVSLRSLTRDSGFYGAEERTDDSLHALGGLVAHVAAMPGRTAIFWVSPGWPVLSGPEVMLSSQQQKNIFHTAIGLSDAMRAGRVTLYAINPVGAGENLLHEFAYEQYEKGAARAGQAQFGDLALQTLAVESGGAAVNSNDTGMLLGQSYRELEHYYEVSYDISQDEAPNTYHQVKVQVDRPDVAAHTRTVYYSAP